MDEHTARLWASIAAEFGLHPPAVVFDILGVAGLEGAQHNMLRVVLNGHSFYPGFQFDPDKHRLRAGVAAIASTADVMGVSHESTVLWMNAGTGQLPGNPRPVDVLEDDPDAVVAAFCNHFGVEW